ncbi:MAG: glycine cleavage system aminomethyltransferase GcvT [Steroidobacteraceae bacterium]
MARRTPLYASHLAAGARMIDFGGWEMPLNYGSQLDEHHAVRRAAGVFDVSHMAVVDLEGERSQELLGRLLANDVAKLTTPGRALYSCMLNEHGMVLDDLIAYYIDDRNYRLVVNAGRRDADLAWIRGHALAFDVAVHERNDLAMLAVQGPLARDKVARLLSSADRATVLALEPFHAASCAREFIARTGYTGEDGFEVILPADLAVRRWQDLRDVEVAPIGLGARDTLRLEAGMNLYGNDMDESTHPLESALAWTCAFEPATRDFLGRAALEAIRRRGSERKLVGLVLEGRGVLRAHQDVLQGGTTVGATTSGGFAPTLGRSIALARIARAIEGEVDVQVRDKPLRARIVKPPFVRHGKVLVAV